MEGITNLKTAIKATKEVVETLGVVLEDGKVSLPDLVRVPSLFRSVNALIKAAQNSQAEIKDISAEEAQELVGELIPLITLIASKFGYKVA